MDMLADLTEIIGLAVYTDKGSIIGNVSDIILETDHYSVDSIYVEKPNPLLVEGGIPIGIPFRWIESIGDIVLLRHFPKYIKTGTGRVEKVKKLRTLADEGPAEASIESVS